MAYLFTHLPFEPESRMTGIWMAHPPVDPDADLVAFAHLVRLGTDHAQDPQVESDFLGSHLPFHLGGFHGQGPDGQGWTYLLQVAPVTAGDVVGASTSWWPMVDAMTRALQFNDEADVRHAQGWTRGDLLEAYWLHGIDTDDLTSWTVLDLLAGLLAQCCHVPLADIVAGKLTGCAFPDIEHRCEHDVFSDVFARWARGELRDLAPDPTVEDDAYDPGDDDEFESGFDLRPVRKTVPAPRDRDVKLLRRFAKTGAQLSTAGDPSITYAHENLAAWRILKVELSDKKYKALRRAVKKEHGPLPKVALQRRLVKPVKVTSGWSRTVEKELDMYPEGALADPVAADGEVPAPRDCCLYHPGHNPHWIQVLKVAPKHGHVFGTLTPEHAPEAAGEWAFRFTPDPAGERTLPDEDCVEVVLFNHDPDRLLGAMAAHGQVGQWTPGVHLFQIVDGDSWPTFNMSWGVVGPCRPSDPQWGA